MSRRRHRVDVYLEPGQLGVYTAPTRVKTILGSCVALCLWDRARHIGGINHFLLPRPGDGTTDLGALHFGSTSCRLLIERMCAGGSRVANLEAAVIGGGQPTGRSGAGRRIGPANAKVALGILREWGIRVVRQETDGEGGRKLLFDTRSGELIVRALSDRLHRGVCGGAR